MKRKIFLLNQLIASSFFLFYFLLRSLLVKQASLINKPPRLVFGPIPILNNKYWSNILKENGYNSFSLMETYYSSINKKEDFDLYYDDIVKKYLSLSSNFLRTLIGPFLAFDYAVHHADIFHISYNGGFLYNTPLRRLEGWLLKLYRKRIVVIVYGSDFYMYSKIQDPSLRHGLLLSYSEYSKGEARIEKRVRSWVKQADILINGFSIDGLGRWDVLPFNMLYVNYRDWEFKQTYSDYDGLNGPVKIIHTPNHRGFKGTEFILKAVKELQDEGYQIDLILLEQLQNQEVKRIMREDADILVEQLIATGYALSGIEGLATGIPVVSNLESEYYTRVFRRYSFLNECPVVSSSPEKIKEVLRVLITSPSLRKELGVAGRKYVEKYHSERAALFLFNKIYDKIWYGENIDLMNLYHPLKPESYNNLSSQILHPLNENKLREFGTQEFKNV